jgi:hypothetical protein
MSTLYSHPINGIAHLYDLASKEEAMQLTKELLDIVADKVPNDEIASEIIFVLEKHFSK